MHENSMLHVLEYNLVTNALLSSQGYTKPTRQLHVLLYDINRHQISSTLKAGNKCRKGLCGFYISNYVCLIYLCTPPTILPSTYPSINYLLSTIYPLFQETIISQLHQRLASQSQIRSLRHVSISCCLFFLESSKDGKLPDIK